MKPPIVSDCHCAADAQLFHHLAELLSNAKSRGEFRTRIGFLMEAVFIASEADALTPNIVEAVRKSIEAYKRTEGPTATDEFKAELHEFRIDGILLPAWLILHSPQPKDGSRFTKRHLLLDVFLNELPFTPTIRDELYLACAETGFNNYFSIIRREAGLREFQARLNEGGLDFATRENYVKFMIDAVLADTLTASHTTHGFELNWYFPVIASLNSSRTASVEFVAKGQIWGLYFRSQSGRVSPPGWDIVLCTLKPYQFDFEGYLYAFFRISSEKKQNVSNSEAISFALHSNYIESADFPAEGDIPKIQTSWSLPNSMAEKCRQHMAESGGCYLVVNVMILPSINSLTLLSPEKLE